MLPSGGRTFDFRIERTVTEDGVGVEAIGFDITPSKRAEAALREVDRRKDEFLATLSRELRNPLTPLKVALDVARLAGNDRAQVERSHAIMERQVDQLSRLVDDLLDLSRITQGKIQSARVPLEAVAIVAAALEASRPLIAARRHEPAWRCRRSRRACSVTSRG